MWFVKEEKLCMCVRQYVSLCVDDTVLVCTSVLLYGTGKVHVSTCVWGKGHSVL